MSIQQIKAKEVLESRPKARAFRWIVTSPEDIPRTGDLLIVDPKSELVRAVVAGKDGDQPRLATVAVLEEVQ